MDGSLNEQNMEAFQSGLNQLAQTQQSKKKGFLGRMLSGQPKRLKIIMWVPEDLVDQIREQQLLNLAPI